MTSRRLGLIALMLASASVANAQDAEPVPAPDPGSVPDSGSVPDPGSEPVPVTEPDPVPVPVAEPVADPPPKKRRGFPRNFVGLEMGYARTGDTHNLYDRGFGRTFVLAIRNWEFRIYENYDLDDKTDTYDDVEYGNGRFGVTSVGRRIWLRDLQGLHVSALVGGAWVRRKMLKVAPDDILSSYQPQRQHGVGLLAGAGVSYEVFDYLSLRADVRLYPMWWEDISGETRAVEGPNHTVNAELIEDSPGGLPMSFNVAAGVAW